MKPSYNHIPLKTGAHISGICKIELAPVKWLQANINVDYVTGVVTSPVNLKLPFIKLELTQNSCKHVEKAKSGKAGDFYDISIQGLSNSIDRVHQNILETLRFDDLLVLITNADGSKKLIGNSKSGMRLMYSIENNNNSNETVIDLSYTSEKPSPYYAVANNTTTTGGLLSEDGAELITEDGNLIITE